MWTRFIDALPKQGQRVIIKWSNDTESEMYYYHGMLDFTKSPFPIAWRLPE